MGCRLNKLEKRDDRRPGNIYSTLKRPQVETKIDVSYEYRFLEFTTLSAAELPRASAVRLASLRDLPTQLLELYQQGFSLVALHPFVQPTSEREKTPLEHIFRAILIKKTDRSQNADLPNEGYVLELDCCSSLDHLTDQKILPEFIKKIQEAASRGLKFVGVVPQYRCPGSPVGSCPPADDQDETQEPGRHGAAEDPGAADAAAGTDGSPEPGQGPRGGTPAAQQPGSSPGEGDGAESPARGTPEGPDADPLSEGPGEPLASKMEIFALFNKPKSPQKRRQYYPVTVPLRVSKNGPTVSGLDANWLEHMSDHFRKGGVLVNAVSWLGLVHDSLHDLTDGVFIFEAVSTEDSRAAQGYDAIVVEQWTVLDGVEVQTDYVPLLNSLAAYGWQLTCVLPTPVVRTTSFSGDSPETRCVTGRGNPEGNSVPGASGKPKKTRRTQKTSFPERETRRAVCPGRRTGPLPRARPPARRRALRRSRVRMASRVWRARLCRMAPRAPARPLGAARGSPAPSLERMWARGLPRGWLRGPRQLSALERHCAGGLGGLCALAWRVAFGLA
uniref:Raftlin, lipid raft linker 1 n=1 Tax=Capra hircus TaxID=9925 RepID=A0A8C2QR17_CAPHI